MKMSDRRLKRILRENPVPVQPKKKEEMLAFARTCDEREKNEETEDGLQMKYMRKHKIRTLVLAAVILSLMAVAVTAGIVNYYYRTPGGKIFDQSGTIVEDAGNISLKMTGEALTGGGYTIEEINWLSYNGQSTFTVWMSADSEEPQNLRAEIDGVEYPLTESFVTRDPDGNLLCVAYSTTNMPEPQNWSPDTDTGNVWILCDEPFISRYIFFEPTDIRPVHTTSDGITVTGYTHNDTLYLGVDDDVMKQSPLNDLISSAWGSFSHKDMTDTDGIVHENFQWHGHVTGDGGIADVSYPLGGIVPSSVTGAGILLTAHIAEKENVTFCEIPIPEEGETLTGEWVIMDAAGIRLTATEITRDKYSLVIYSPDEFYLLNYPEKLEQHEKFDDSCFAESLYSIIIHAGIAGIEDLEDPVGFSTAPPASGKKWRVASKQLEEYCKTHDTIRLAVKSLELYYDDTWTLTFPEN